MHPRPHRIGTLLCALALGCSPEGLDESDDYDVVVTAREPAKDFGGYETFAMGEEVIDLSALSDDPIEIDHSLDQTLLDAVALGMANEGYERIADPDGDTADVQIVVGVVASNNWGWYGYYPWYGYPGWYWYYPPVAVPVNTPSGSVVVLMIDRNDASQDDVGMNLAPVVWSGVARGLLSSYGTTNAARAERLIDQMFEQSPYLEVGPPVDPQPGLQPDAGADDDGGAL